MSSSFTSHDDLCGSRLLSLVCRGHCLIAKVLESANEIPTVFSSGYVTDNFAGYFHQDGNSKNDGSFFSSKTVLNMFGAGKGNPEIRLKKIRCQAPSYTQRCSRHSELEGLENKYISILVDFSYLSNPDKFDGQDRSKINSNDARHGTVKEDGPAINMKRKSAAEQEYLERDFALKYQSTLKTFYALFEEIYDFYSDINSFTTELDAGHFVQYSLRSLLLDSNEAKQLLCEVLYLYGSLLILLDIYIPGEIRERLIIAHYRFCKTNERNGKVSNFEDLCKMFQRTDYQNDPSQNVSSKQKRDDESLKPQIQTELLTRLPLPSVVIKSIIECLVSGELYPNQAFAFPSYEHRSAKLAQQASMLVVVLYFDPQIMKQNTSIMRQVVDKFFHDTWTVPLYNGTVLDLSVEWEMRFPAAMNAIGHVIDATNIEKLNYENMKVTIACLDEVKRYLVQNVLTSTFLLDHESKIFDFLRAANATLRWQVLHRTSHLCPKSESGSSAMIVDEHDILSLILLVSQLEVQLSEIYRQLLKNKEVIWTNCQENAIEKVTRLSKHFLGNESLKTVEKNEDLGRWFEQMVDEIQSLDYREVKTGGEIQMCIEALDDIRRLDLIDRNAQVVIIIKETRANLVHMAKSANVKDNICSVIDNIADFTYAREIMESLVPMLHSQSMRDPKSVTLLRAFFLKMGRPNARLQKLVEISQNDLAYVTEFHESAMLAFVKETLDVIPITIFSTLAHIADEKSLSQLPAKIESDRLADYLHSEDRYKLAKITYELSVLTKGIFAMKKTLIGNLEIKPKSILEEGLRKELVRQFSTALHNSLQFEVSVERSKQAMSDHMHACNEIFAFVGSRVEGFQRSMIWLQDFLEIDGLHIFIHETSRVVKFNVEHELMNMTQKSATLLDSTDNGVSIPLFARSESDPNAANFIGRTMNALIHLTEPKFTTFSNYLYGWYFSSGEQVCGMKTISSLRNAIGMEGVVGIEKLLCFRIKNELSRFLKFYGNIQTYVAILEQFRDAIFPEWKCPKNGINIYEAVLKKLVKLMVPLTKSFCRIGQLQLLRRMLKNELRLTVDVKVSQSCIVANKGMMNGIFNERSSMDEMMESMENLSDVMISSGLTNPMATVFLSTNSLEGLPSLITLFVIHTMRELSFDSDFGSLVGKEDESIDGWSIVAGIATILRQFNATYTKSVFALLGQYLTCSMASHLARARTEDLPRVSKEAQNILIFMRQLCSIANLDSSIIFQQVPQHLVELIRASN